MWLAAVNAVGIRCFTFILGMEAPTSEVQQGTFAYFRHMTKVTAATASQGAVNKQMHLVA